MLTSDTPRVPRKPCSLAQTDVVADACLVEARRSPVNDGMVQLTAPDELLAGPFAGLGTGVAQACRFLSIVA